MALLTDGHGFGELALIHKKATRAARCQCIEDTYCAILTRKDFETVIGAGMERRINEKAKFMQKFMITKGITLQTLLRLTYFLREKRYTRRDYVYKEGDISDGIHFIKAGEF